MSNYDARPCWRAQLHGRCPRVCFRGPCTAAWPGKSRAQDVAVAAVDSSPRSFTFRVTAKQAAAATSSKLRLDMFLATHIAADLAVEPLRSPQQDVSRAKVQAAIAAGLVRVNGRPVGRPSQQLKAGDCIECSLPPPPPVMALPEPIPLDIKYEDDHVIVINKPAGMVVHVAPGHHSGTLVNALLAHCALPAMDLDVDPISDLVAATGRSSGSRSVGELEDDGDDVADDDEEEDEDADGDVGVQGRAPEAFVTRRSMNGGSSSSSRSSGSSAILRPGIVHRLDKGTSGLIVVAKTELALTRLQAQFKARAVDRVYDSITIGCPASLRGRVETNIVRDPRDRKRMAAAPFGSGRGRTAGSGFTVLSPLAGGGAALVQWKLDTGRTHQIRVHAKHIGHPLLGDDTYGGTATAAVAAARSLPADAVKAAVVALGRPALHARTLGFTHPVSGVRLSFEEPPPDDFGQTLRQLGVAERG